MSHFSWNLVANGFISAYVVNVSNVFTSKQPTIFWCTGPVKEDLGMILEELHGMELCGVLLRVIRFCELVLDEMLSVDLSSHSCTLLDL